MTDPWACPRCDHALVPFYSRPWRRGWRTTYWRGCVACAHRERYTPNRPAMTMPWPSFVAGSIVVVLVFALAAYGWGRMLGTW